MFSSSKQVHVYISFLWKEKETNNTVISLRNHDSDVAYYKSKSKQYLSEIKVCIITASKKGFTNSFTLNQCSVKFEKNATACYTNVNFIDTSTQLYTVFSKEMEFIIEK